MCGALSEGGDEKRNGWRKNEWMEGSGGDEKGMDGGLPLEDLGRENPGRDGGRTATF